MNTFQKVRGLSKKKKYIMSGVVVLVIGASVGAYAAHTEQVQAQQAQEKKEAEEKAYEKLINAAETKIEKAYESRHNEDIESATEAIEKLKENDKKMYQEEITKLQGFIDQLESTNKLILTAEKSKNQTDVDKAQKAIDNEKDEYLKNDKKAHQERLNKVKTAIQDKKAKEEQAKKAAEEKKKEEEKKAAEAQNQQTQVPNQQEQGTDTDLASPSTTVTGNESANDVDNSNPTNGTNYQAPAQAAVPNQPATPQAPAGGGNTGSQGGGQQSVTPKPSTPTPDYEPAGRVSPWFMSASEAYAWAEANLNDNDYNRARVEGTSFSDGTIRSCVVLG